MSTITVSFSSAEFPKTGHLALVIDAATLGAQGKALDRASKGALSKAISAQNFKGKVGESLTVLAPPSGHTSITLISAGKGKDVTASGLEGLGGQLFMALLRVKAKDVAVAIDLESSLDVAALLASGARLRSYRFDKYRTTLKADDKPSVSTLSFYVGKAATAAKKAYAALGAVADAVVFTRDLMNEPANALYPESFAERIVGLKKLGLKVTVLKAADIKKHKMGALYAVGQASDFEPRVVAIEWQGNPKAKSASPLALMGKGVTFDTGGLAIKSLGGMVDMKFDMGGAAAVVGTMMALALRKAKANVVGVVGLVENAISGNAMRPSDVVTSMSGQTVEVVNTDAEGRLVLADILTYTQRTYKPVAMVDVATLTGAIITTLGPEFAGLMASDDALAGKLEGAGKATGELVWRLPLHEAYDPGLNSSIADMKNMGYAGEAGSIAAAMFIKRFVEKDTPWAHLDIAGTAWVGRDRALSGKGATGYGVRLLNKLVADHYEK